jgi:NAD(P)-dependent dehydrogenase (short-subunit alcohol dehydrogenase family)
MRTAVVTGGASGIGEATARVLAREGYRVLIGDVNDERGAAVVDAIAAGGGRSAFRHLDLASEGDVDAFARWALGEAGAIDALVNSGGILQNAIRATDMRVEDFDRLWSINVRGTFLMCRALAPAMCAAGHGSIVNLCSLTTFRPSPQPGYAVGKAGLGMMTEVLAAELGPSGVRVNAVAPGYTLTPAMKGRIERGERDPAKVIDASALRRFVEPEEVAELILFLCGDRASAITGATIPIDCGWLAYSAYRSHAAMP